MALVSAGLWRRHSSGDRGPGQHRNRPGAAGLRGAFAAGGGVRAGVSVRPGHVASAAVAPAAIELST
jgi:hypothetical protein